MDRYNNRYLYTSYKSSVFKNPFIFAEQKFFVSITVPLMMAYVTRYIFGTDKLRRNAFEVRGLNGARTGVIHCDDSAILSQWLKYITDNITGLTHLQVETTN